MSFATSPKLPPKKAVAPPKAVSRVRVAGANSNTGDNFNNKYIPAVTSVAACSNADTGVGLMLARPY